MTDRVALVTGGSRGIGRCIATRLATAGAAVVLTARTLEAAGLPTVAVYIRAFRHQARLLRPPRTLITPHILGRTIGAPGDVGRQREVVRAAVRLLDTAKVAGTIEDIPGPYRPALVQT